LSKGKTSRRCLIISGSNSITQEEYDELVYVITGVPK
jgi:hypothetical protein